MAGRRDPQRGRSAAEQGLREGHPSPTEDWYGATEAGPSVQDRDWSEMMPDEDQRLRRPSLGLLPRRLDATHDSNHTYPEPNADQGRHSQVSFGCQ